VTARGSCELSLCVSSLLISIPPPSITLQATSPRFRRLPPAAHEPRPESAAFRHAPRQPRPDSAAFRQPRTSRVPTLPPSASRARAASRPCRLPPAAHESRPDSAAFRHAPGLLARIFFAPGCFKVGASIAGASRQRPAWTTRTFFRSRGASKSALPLLEPRGSVQPGPRALFSLPEAFQIERRHFGARRQPGISGAPTFSPPVGYRTRSHAFSSLRQRFQHQLVDQFCFRWRPDSVWQHGGAAIGRRSPVDSWESTASRRSPLTRERKGGAGPMYPKAAFRSAPPDSRGTVIQVKAWARTTPGAGGCQRGLEPRWTPGRAPHAQLLLRLAARRPCAASARGCVGPAPPSGHPLASVLWPRAAAQERPGSTERRRESGSRRLANLAARTPCRRDGLAFNFVLAFVLTNVSIVQVLPHELRSLRDSLHLSRAALARFLGVAEITILRWEQGADTSPKGLVLTVLRALQAATLAAGPATVARLVQDGAQDQVEALHRLFELATSTNPSRRK
jgi:DNA-binding XRE family transcriptional regulator